MYLSKYLIILVNYNNWSDTVECVHSLLKEGINPSDICIIENSSTDNSYFELTSRLKDIQITKTKNNLGFSGANNLGIKSAMEKKAEYIILLNNDTIVGSNSIQELIREMDSHPEAGMGTGQIRYFPESEIIWYGGGKLIGWRGLAVHLRKGKKANSNNLKPGFVTFISGCYLCIRAKAIENLGFLNEKFFLYLEDIEYSARAYNRGIKQLYVPGSIIFHKCRGDRELKANTLYYSVRNRELLIDLSFPRIAKVYFFLVIRMKLLIWYFINKKAYKFAKSGLMDYQHERFGQIDISNVEC